MRDETEELIDWYEEIYGSSEFQEVRELCKRLRPVMEECDRVWHSLNPDPVIVTTNAVDTS